MAITIEPHQRSDNGSFGVCDPTHWTVGINYDLWHSVMAVGQTGNYSAYLSCGSCGYTVKYAYVRQGEKAPQWLSEAYADIQQRQEEARLQRQAEQPLPLAATEEG